MGWKTLKERFGIEHIVQVNDDNEVCIGSGYVSELIVINPETGTLKSNPLLSGRSLKEGALTALLEASPEEIKEALDAQDQFSESIPVYTYEDGAILTKYCEQTGWPNLTHDGQLMYENRFSTDRNQVIEWAQRDAAAKVRFLEDSIRDKEEELEDLRKKKAMAQRNQEQLMQL